MSSKCFNFLRCLYKKNVAHCLLRSIDLYFNVCAIVIHCNTSFFFLHGRFLLALKVNTKNVVMLACQLWREAHNLPVCVSATVQDT